MNYLWVGIGGFFGAVSRYALSGWINRRFQGGWFPYGTMACNILGCLIIGILAGIAESRSIFSPQTRLLIFVGLLGGFTTFSSFGLETIYLLRENLYLPAFLNVFVSITAGSLLLYIGLQLTK